MFVITALVAVLVVLDGGTFYVPLLLAIIISVNTVTVATSRLFSAETAG